MTAPTDAVRAAMLADALAAAERGRSIVPLGPDKRPVGEWKRRQSERATTDEIKRLARNARVTGFGIVTGEISGVVVLDFDGDEGRRLLATLDLQPHVRTGRGGFHIHVEHPGFKVKTRAGVRPGFDVRGDGGVAGITGRSRFGAYEILRDLDDLVPIAALPADLARDILADDSQMGDESPATRPASPRDVQVGQRHDYLLRIACGMRGDGFGAEVIESKLQRINAEFRQPHSGDEVCRLAQDVAARWQPNGSSGDLCAPVIAAAGQYLHMTSTDHVRVTLAVAATADLDGDPVWLYVVGDSSSGKSEAISLLADVAWCVDELTVAGLLGWVGSPTKGRKVGLLAHAGGRDLATISDLSVLLAGSDRGERDKVYAALRRIYDGAYTRHIGNIPEPLTWAGRLTLLAGVTHAIDSYASHADALGTRFLYCRVPGLSDDAKKQATRMARELGPRKRELRHDAREAATAAVRQAQTHAAHVTIGEAVAEAIDRGALIASLGRAAVPRSSYGSRDVIGEVAREGPGRIAGQLATLATGLLALGTPEADTARIVQRCAIDSIPLTRAKVLRALVPDPDDKNPGRTVAEIARKADCDRKVTRRALEDLALIGLVSHNGADDEDDAHPRRVRWRWRVASDAHDQVAETFRNVGTPPPSPQEEEEDHGDASNGSEHSQVSGERS